MTSKLVSLQAITVNRAKRLCRLLALVARAPRNRDALLKVLRIDLRSLYRDFEQLRRLGIRVVLIGGNYSLQNSLESALNQLPCPNPQLSFGEAKILSEGPSETHSKLRRLLDQLLPPQRTK